MDIPEEAARAAALWSGLNLLLMLVLSALVVRLRFRHGVAIGHNKVPQLVAATRAHGNAAEYIPAIVAALAVMVLVGAPALWVHAIGGLLFVGRLLHAVALSRNTGPSFGRIAGMVITFTAYAAAALVLLLHAF